MRLRRALAPGEGYYHVISRITGQQFLMDAEEKDVLLGLLDRVAEFSGVEILTFALMDNHFHLLLKVPKAKEIDDRELVRRMHVLYGDRKTERILHDWGVWKDKGLIFKVTDAKAALRRRMYDLAQFCKTLKETYSMSYNYRHAHSGSIWGSRFKSVLLSPDYQTLMTVGAYIDLNPVRAGIVDTATDYAWSGFALASKGHATASRGIRSLVAMAHAKREIPITIALEAYAAAIEGFVGPIREEQEAKDETHAPVPPPVQNRPRQVFNAKKVERKIETGEKLSLFELLRCRVRHFSHGLVVGAVKFVHDFVRARTPRKDTWRAGPNCKGANFITAHWLRGDDKISVSKKRKA